MRDGVNPVVMARADDVPIVYGSGIAGSSLLTKRKLILITEQLRHSLGESMRAASSSIPLETPPTCETVCDDGHVGSQSVTQSISTR